MAGTFMKRTKELSDRVGDGPLEGKVEVDQVYAKYQHEDLSLSHPGGGGAQYLGGPLMDQHLTYLGRIAQDILDDGPKTPMVRAMEDLSEQVYKAAPFEFGDLKASGHPQVRDNGEMFYNRQPLVHRLSEDEINIKRELRELGLGNIGAL